MKSYTDIEQSKKLAEILPIESADMCYKCLGEDPYDIVMRPYTDWKEEYKGLLVNYEVDVIPCWSLAALFDILPKSLIYTPNPTLDGYCCKNIMHDLETYGDNPIDTCYEMVLELHKGNDQGKDPDG